MSNGTIQEIGVPLITVTVTPTAGGSGSKVSRRFLPDNDLKLYAFALLKNLEDIKEIVRTRITLWSEHPVKALALFVQGLGKLFKAYRRVDVVPEDRLSHFDVSGEKGVDRFD